MPLKLSAGDRAKVIQDLMNSLSPESDELLDEACEEAFAADWAYAYDQLSQGEFSQYQGQFVAISGRKVIGVEQTQEKLEALIRTTTSYNPDHLVVLWNA